MNCGDYSIEFDRTGFPLIRRRNWNYYISLFPVSKYQFERFMAENGPKGNLYTDDWYESLLEANPRGSWEKQNGNLWELFLTGIGVDEITPFLEYMGRDFGLPEVGQWKQLLSVSTEIKELKSELTEKFSTMKTTRHPL